MFYRQSPSQIESIAEKLRNSAATVTTECIAGNGSMGHRSMGQMDHFCMGYVGHGSVYVVDPRATIISSTQQVTVKYRQMFTVKLNTHGSLWIVILQHSIKCISLRSAINSLCSLIVCAKCHYHNRPRST